VGDSGSAGSAIGLRLYTGSITNVFYLLGSDIRRLKNVLSVPVPALLAWNVYFVGSDVVLQLINLFFAPVPVPRSVLAV
jgi:hypothetical protein